MRHSLNQFLDNDGIQFSTAKGARTAIIKVFVLLGALLLVVSTSGPAAVRTWDGQGNNDANWSTKQNWGSGSDQAVPVNNDSLVFGGTARLINNNDLAVGTTFTGLTFNNTAGAFVLNGNAINLGGGITNNSSSLQTINLALNLTGNRTINAASGNITVNGVISGSGGIEMAGNNTLTLNGVNTYSGGTTLRQGTVVMGSDRALGTGGINFAGGTLNANNQNASIGALTLSGSSTLNLGASGSLNFASATQTSGTLTINNWSATGPTIHITTADTAFLNNVFFDVGGTLHYGVLDNNNFLVAGNAVVPEPIHYALGIFGLVFVSVRAGRAYRARRRTA
jgi:autotransporter-associated beta strand protein